MKRLCPLFVTLLVISCSSDDPSAPEFSPEQLLVAGSPWLFSEYRIDEVINTDGVLLDDDDLTNEIARQNAISQGLTLIFETDGTGRAIENLAEETNFDWTLSATSALTLNYEEGNAESFDVFSLTESILIISFDDEFEVILDDQSIRGVDIKASAVFD
ncbi:MAG: hypothetical protein AAFU57_09155 [Bacteroidota bacterium]